MACRSPGAPAPSDKGSPESEPASKWKIRNIRKKYQISVQFATNGNLFSSFADFSDLHFQATARTA
jgi:hypothetical protein